MEILVNFEDDSKKTGFVSDKSDNRFYFNDKVSIEQAELLLLTNVDCTQCWNCIDCERCHSCNDSSNLINCQFVFSSKKCTNLVCSHNCLECVDSKKLTSCLGCVACENLTDHIRQKDLAVDLYASPFGFLQLEVS